MCYETRVLRSGTAIDARRWLGGTLLGSFQGKRTFDKKSAISDSKPPRRFSKTFTATSTREYSFQRTAPDQHGDAGFDTSRDCMPRRIPRRTVTGGSVVRTDAFPKRIIILHFGGQQFNVKDRFVKKEICSGDGDVCSPSRHTEYVYSAQLHRNGLQFHLGLSANMNSFVGVHRPV